MSSKIQELLAFIETHDGINDKSKLCNLVADKFSLTKDRSVYYCKDRFGWNTLKPIDYVEKG